MSYKKFKEIKLKNNPLKDPRCKRILEREKLPVKPLLQHLSKVAKQAAQGGGGGGGKKGKKGKKNQQVSSEEEEEDDEEEEEEEEGEQAAGPKAGLNADAIKKRITLIYQNKNPEKLADVGDLMTKYTGKEDALYAAMVKKYAIKESFFTAIVKDRKKAVKAAKAAKAKAAAEKKKAAAEAAAAAAAAAAKAAASSSEEDSGSEEESSEEEAAEVAAPTRAPQPGDGLSVAVLRERINRLYEAKNPAKYEEKLFIRKLLIKFKGHEQVRSVSIESVI